MRGDPMTNADVRALVACARVYGLPEMKRDQQSRRNIEEIEEVLAKWDESGFAEFKGLAPPDSEPTEGA